MFHGLKDAWNEMLEKSGYIADDNGVHITFPQHLFDRVEQEFNLCFIEQDEDIHFKLWQREGDNDKDQD